MLEWTSSLPAVIEEDKGKEFTVNVKLGSASQFLSYNQIQRTFEQIPWLSKLEEEVFAVQIEIVG